MGRQSEQESSSTCKDHCSELAGRLPTCPTDIWMESWDAVVGHLPAALSSDPLLCGGWLWSDVRPYSSELVFRRWLCLPLKHQPVWKFFLEVTYCDYGTHSHRTSIEPPTSVTARLWDELAGFEWGVKLVIPLQAHTFMIMLEIFGGRRGTLGTLH